MINVKKYGKNLKYYVWSGIHLFLVKTFAILYFSNYVHSVINLLSIKQH